MPFHRPCSVKRLKQFYKEEKERRRLGLTDEDAYERFAVVCVS